MNHGLHSVEISESAFQEMKRWKKNEGKEDLHFRLKACPTGEC